MESLYILISCLITFNSKNIKKDLTSNKKFCIECVFFSPIGNSTPSWRGNACKCSHKFWLSEKLFTHSLGIILHQWLSIDEESKLLATFVCFAELVCTLGGIAWICFRYQVSKHCGCTPRGVRGVKRSEILW